MTITRHDGNNVIMSIIKQRQPDIVSSSNRVNYFHISTQMLFIALLITVTLLLLSKYG